MSHKKLPGSSNQRSSDPRTLANHRGDTPIMRFFQSIRQRRLRQDFELLESRRMMTAGAIDVTYGDRGFSTVNLPAIFTLPTANNAVMASVTLPDGKTIVATSYLDAADRIVDGFSRLTKLTIDGQIDTTFSGLNSSVIVQGSLTIWLLTAKQDHSCK